MTPGGILSVALQDADRIVAAIGTGAAWEIWMQVELMLKLRAQGLQVVREAPYPAPNSRAQLDLLIQEPSTGRKWAIELKVESAWHAGPLVLTYMLADREKVATYQADGLQGRWTLGIAWSQPAVQAFCSFAKEHPDFATVVKASGSSPGSGDVYGLVLATA